MLKRIIAAFLAAWVAFAFSAEKPLNQVTGTITTQNLVAAGDATAGSAVEIDVTGIAAVTVQVTGTYTASGGLSAQITTDRQNWVTECSSSCTTTFTRRTTGAQTATITSGQQDIYQVQFANGAKRLRITALGAVTGEAKITIQPSDVGAGSGGSGGGGGASTIADGADVALGATTDAAATAGGTGTVSAKLRRISTQLPAALGPTTSAGSFSVTPASDATYTLTSTGYSASVTLTRTADTNAYAAGDVVGAATGSTAALQFSSMGPSGGRIMITSVSIEIDASAIISGETSYTLYLYNVTPPSALGDNAAFDLPSGDRASFLGSINLGTPVDLGSTLFLATDAVNKQLKLSGTSLFGYLVTTGAYTPTSARVYVVTLHAVSL